MTLFIYDKFITKTSSGETVPAAVVTIYKEGGSLASLYLDSAGTTPAGNPVTASSAGRVQVYMEAGTYTVSAMSGGSIINYPDVLVGSVAQIEINGATVSIDEYLSSIKTWESINSIAEMESDDSQLLYETGSIIETTVDGKTYRYKVSDTNPGNLAILSDNIWKGLNLSLSGGKYAVLQCEDIPDAYITAKTAPSKAKFVGDAELILSNDQIVDGNGNTYPGKSATDLVYRTAHNSLGGTNGSTLVRARFAVEITDLVNPITFEVQLDPSLDLSGIDVRLIYSDSSELESSSLSYASTTDNGGGNYTFGPWNPTGNKTYYGLEVRLIPVDSSNDATLHDEYFVIQRILITQSINTLLDSIEAIDSTTWAQKIFASYTSTFVNQVLPSANGNDVYITHSLNMSGSYYNWAFCSPSGSGDGTAFSPMSLSDAREIYNKGLIRTLFLSQGTYGLSGQLPASIFTPSGSSKIVCQDGSALFDFSDSIPFSSMTAVGNHYEVSYDPSNHYQADNIANGTSSPKVITDTINETFKQVTDSALVDTTDFTFYWDHDNSKFLIRFDGVLTDDVHVPLTGFLFNGDSLDYFGLSNVYCKGVQAAFLKLDTGKYYETYNTGTTFGNAYGDIFDIDDIDGVQVDDKAYKSANDGLNYHGYGHTDLFNCEALYCSDDGISHHDECTGYIQGGEYSYNGKGGVIPAFGAKITCYKVTANYNLLGDSTLASLGNYGGFVCLSDDTDDKLTQMVCVDCDGDNNYVTFLSSGGMSSLTTYDCRSTNASTYDYASRSWSTNDIDGSLTRIKSSGSSMLGYPGVFKTDSLS